MPPGSAEEVAMAREVYVDQDVCIGCGLCTNLVPEVFRLNDNGVSEVYNESGSTEAKIQEAIDSCPVNCIHWR
jgi:ferredoxin